MPKQNNQINNWPAIFSAISAFLALCFSIVVYYQTRQLLGPTERPVICISRLPVNYKINEEEKKVLWILNFIYKNIGKNPASNLRIRVAFCKEGNEQSLKQYVDVSSANRIDPNQEFSIVHAISQGLQIDGDKKIISHSQCYFYVLVTYQDTWTKKDYDDPYYLIYKSGESSAGHATEQDKIKIEPYVNALYYKNKDK